MKISIIVAFLVATLTGCQCDKKEEVSAESTKTKDTTEYKPMTNEEIAAETKKCDEMGLRAQSLINKESFGARIIYIQCQPKTDE